MTGNLEPPWAHEERDHAAREKFAETINEIQGWCPMCGGSGMVMEWGPTDCPNVDTHRLLVSMEAALPTAFFLPVARGGDD